MDGQSLTQFYDTLKQKLDEPQEAPGTPMINVQRSPGGLDKSPGELMWRNKAAHHAEHLKDKCRKHILVDMYCKIIPLDQDYVCGHHGQMQADVDSMLDKKGLTASQYLTSCYEATHAPLLEFILRSTDNIGKSYLEDAKETLKDAQENDVKLPEPEEPDVDDENVEGQIVDIEKDTEYESFIDKLKAKTIQKIVDDVSKIINDKKEENEMTFDTSPADDSVTESTVSIGVDYLQKHLWKESVSLTPELQEEMIGMAIREATLNQFDVVFNQPGASLKEYRSKINYGKGAIINESATSYFKESTNTEARYEPLYKEVDGNKYDISNYEKVAEDGKKTPMTDSEAKSVLDAEGYKKYQNRNKK